MKLLNSLLNTKKLVSVVVVLLMILQGARMANNEISSHDIYYKNNYFDYGDEAVLLEKSTKKEGFIKPNIVIPRYKSVAKTVDEKTLRPDINMSMSADNVSTAENYNSNSGEVEINGVSGGSNNISFSSDIKKKEYFEEYRSANILENGVVKKQKTLFVPKKTNSKEEKIPIMSKNQKKDGVFNHTSQDNEKSNVYFAENDIDFLVKKKINEQNENSTNAFVNHSINKSNKKTEKEIEEELNEHKKEIAEKLSEEKSKKEQWKNRLEEILKDLKNKILENPKDFDFYFKDAAFDFKQELIKDSVIEPKSYILDSEKEFDLQRLEKLEKIHEKSIKKENSIKEEIIDKTKETSENKKDNKDHDFKDKEKLIASLEQEIQKESLDLGKLVNSHKQAEKEKKIKRKFKIERMDIISEQNKENTINKTKKDIKNKDKEENKEKKHLNKDKKTENPSSALTNNHEKSNLRYFGISKSSKNSKQENTFKFKSLSHNDEVDNKSLLSEILKDLNN